jgi:hypothetical protein
MEGSEILRNERITQAPSGEEKAAAGSSGRDNEAGLVEALEPCTSAKKVP